MGGKQLLVPHLLPMIPKHSTYVEVFGGAGSLLLNKPPSSLEVYNDLDGELVNLFEVIRDDVDAFLKHAHFLLYSCELYQSWQRELKRGVVPEDRVERALRYWYLIMCSFGAHPYKGWGFNKHGRRSLSTSMQNALGHLQLIHERLKTVQIDHLDFRKCIERYDDPNTFLFLDPPYLDTSPYRIGKFTLEDHRALADLLRSVKGKWLMTIGNRSDIRELYSKLPSRSISSPTSIEKVTGSKRTHFANLVIHNYMPPETPLLVATASESMLLDMFTLR